MDWLGNIVVHARLQTDLAIAPHGMCRHRHNRNMPRNPTGQLARSGCRKFLLIDEDIFLPENICRNELSWDAVGVHKAEAVREALSLLRPTSIRTCVFIALPDKSRQLLRLPFSRPSPPAI